MGDSGERQPLTVSALDKLIYSYYYKLIIITTDCILKKELKGDIMVTTSPLQTEATTRFQEHEDSRTARQTPVEVQKAEAEEERATTIERLPEVWVSPRKEPLPARIAKRVVAFASSGFLYFDWLSEPPMTKRDWGKREIAKARSEWYIRSQICP